MQKRRKSILLPCVFLLLVACIAAGGLLGGAWWLTGQASAAFGQPGDGLTPPQRVWYALELYLHMDDLTQPSDPAGQPRVFTVEMGESVNTIAYQLENAGLIPDAASFRTLLIYTGQDTGVQAGDYQLSPAMTAVQIAQALQDATPKEVVFVILEGWRMEEIAAALPTSGLSFSPDEFLAAARQAPTVDQVGVDLPQATSLEGFLFPDSYRLPRDISLNNFLATVTQDFRVKVDSDLMQGFNKQGLDLYQAVTLASIVQREAVLPEEQPLIASVFLNRLAAGIKLDSDPTVQYAVGYNAAQATWWTNPLSAADLQFDSPYNTYLYPALPPGPIANPGISALRAVAYPAETPYYYFQAACDGSGKHQFAETYEQHLQNSCP